MSTEKSSKPCTVCQGAKALQVGGVPVACPICGGSGKDYDPGIYFAYGITINLNGNQALNAQAIVINDRPFRWMFAAAVSTGDFTSLVKSSRNKRPFSNQQLRRDVFWGTAQSPLPLVTPYVFLQTEQILIDLTDLSGGANRVDLCFIGVELSQ